MSRFLTYLEPLDKGLVAVKRDELDALLDAARCREYRPDHNGECLNCDEWCDAHDAEAIAAGEAAAALRTPPKVVEGPWGTPHAKLAKDCWRMIRALLPVKGEATFPPIDEAAERLIEMACDSAAIVARATPKP